MAKFPRGAGEILMELDPGPDSTKDPMLPLAVQPRVGESSHRYLLVSASLLWYALSTIQIPS